MTTNTGIEDEQEKKIMVVGISGPSSSGKTTLSQLVRRLLPNSILIHEDDYYKPDKEIPVDPKTGEENWDCPEALNCGTLTEDILKLKSHQASDIQIHSIQPKYNNALKPEVESRIATKIQSRMKELSQYKIVILDGFLLYYPYSPISKVLDKKLFLRAEFELLKKRRESREGYQTKDSFWVDPPGYFETLVWPNFVNNHKHLFKEGNVENGELVNSEETKGIELFTVGDNTGIDEITEWSIETILKEL